MPERIGFLEDDCAFFFLRLVFFDVRRAINVSCMHSFDVLMRWIIAQPLPFNVL
jgi:hypothetical protein